MLGKRNCRDEAWLRLNRKGMALRERSAPCIPIRVTWGLHRRGSAPMFITAGIGEVPNGEKPGPNGTCVDAWTDFCVFVVTEVHVRGERLVPSGGYNGIMKPPGFVV